MGSIKSSSHQVSINGSSSSYHRSKDINLSNPNRSPSNHSSHQKQYTSSTPTTVRSSHSLPASPHSSRSLSSPHHSPLLLSPSKPLQSLIIDENQDDYKSVNDGASRRTIHSSGIGSDHRSNRSDYKENPSRREIKSLMTTTPTTFNIAYSPSIDTSIRTSQKGSIRESHCTASQIGSNKTHQLNPNMIEKIEEETRLESNMIRGIGCERNSNDLAEIILGLINCLKLMKKQVVVLKEWNLKRKENKKIKKIEKEKEKNGKKGEGKGKNQDLEVGGIDEEEELKSLKSDKEKLLHELNQLVNPNGSKSEMGNQVEINLCRINSYKSNFSSIQPKLPEEVCVWQKEGSAGWRVRKLTLKHDDEIGLKGLDNDLDPKEHLKARSQGSHQAIIHHDDSLTYPSRSTIS
ncbi:uncharacterized protein MELLADRAFT_109218 [Melampsora larici-populina 98AG31]|uniref:Uncharacterized protein n=1 Tax=Melampsora larici-populina (strain 98AG31 / pathotype 3-4-7) TaxID=747676 RepID=F4RVR9_MELLP|nr:uncharacterized protein MELLADRAFT_109218 [Melampsora larici-populina 98AG31]EGG03538.1 hypothetical protein MELLADRAFT_109218 [Melampsora larici-populina 98AG31]